MGNPVVAWAVALLRAGDFPAGEAGNGTKAPILKEPGAAVSLHSADWKQQTVTLSIRILCPEAFGAARCRNEAWKAGEILNQAGIRCTQGRCTYDGLSRTYGVELLGELTGRIQGEEFLPGPGFTVALGEKDLPWTVSFRAEQIQEVENQYELATGQPVGLVSGEKSWKLELTELIPPGMPEESETEEPFALTVDRCGVREQFFGCRWRNQRRDWTAKGLQRVRTGICTHREVTNHG